MTEVPFSLLNDFYFGGETTDVVYITTVKEMLEHFPYRFYINLYNDVVLINFEKKQVRGMTHVNSSHTSVYSEAFIKAYNGWKEEYPDEKLLVNPALCKLIYRYKTKTVYTDLFSNSLELALPVQGKDSEYLMIGYDNTLCRFSSWNSLPFLAWVMHNIKFIKGEGLKEDVTGKEIIIEYLTKSVEHFSVYYNMVEQLQFTGTIEPFAVRKDNKLVAICDALFKNFEIPVREPLKEAVKEEPKQDKLPMKEMALLSDIVDQTDGLKEIAGEGVVDVFVDMKITGLKYDMMQYYPQAKYLLIYTEQAIAQEELEKIIGYECVGTTSQASFAGIMTKED